MFSIDQCDRLSYDPFRHYQLPRLVHEYDPGNRDRYLRVEFCRGEDTDGDGFGPPVFRRPLYKLQWPGETEHPASFVPYRPLSKLPWMKKYAGEEWANRMRAEVPISRVWEKWALSSNPDHMLPEALAYHIAVNPHCMGREEEPRTPPIAGLPRERVDQVLQARFAIDTNAMATLNYLKWVAESHYRHPFFQGFDTNIRETLYGLQHEAVRLFFYLLADYRYDHNTRWWDRSISRFVWYRLATYLHWVGRTGKALYGELSHIRRPEGIRPDVVLEYMQDVVNWDREWIQNIDYLPDEEVEGDVKVPV